MTNQQNIEAHKWKPGQSGNRAGRPRGSKNISSYIRDMLNDPNFVQKLQDGTEIRGAPIEAIIKTAIAKAISGDVRAMEFLARHGWGTKVDFTSDQRPTPILNGPAAKPKSASSSISDTCPGSQARNCRRQEH